MKVGDRRGLVLIDEYISETAVREVKRISLTGVVRIDSNATHVSIASANVKETKPHDDTCAKCGATGAYQPYSVHDELWPLAKDKLLHVWCLEGLIGRRVTREDLKPCTWNDFVKHVMA